MPARPPMPTASSPPTLAELKAARYTPVAIGLHWLLALLILGALGLGLYMTGLPFSPQRVRFYSWHKWTGIAILLLSAVRLLWRLGHPPPGVPDFVLAAMPRWQRTGRTISHRLMYLLFFAVPLLGWAQSSALGVPVVWFGVLPLPDFVPVDRALAEQWLQPLHRAGAYLLAAVSVLHVAAVVKHQWIARDGLLRRMWPGPSSTSRKPNA
jgi:cytochrome b561